MFHNVVVILNLGFHEFEVWLLWGAYFAFFVYGHIARVVLLGKVLELVELHGWAVKEKRSSLGRVFIKIEVRSEKLLVILKGVKVEGNLRILQ